ncbi:MAG: hypothetical protein DYG92_01235 [Leptolyngbya sp. PLA1]|nr:hypothetical protein [Leptolyngbya sp. PLA1]
MNALRQTTDTVRKTLGGMNLTQRLLVGAVVVVVILAMVVVSLLTSKPDMVDLVSGGGEDAQKAQAALVQAGIKAVPTPTGLAVPASKVAEARAALAQAGALPGDKATYFEALIARNDWMNSRQVNERNYIIALQNELGRTLGGFRGVSKGSVQLSVPDRSGLGNTTRRPSASIALTSDTGLALPQQVVDAAAKFVAGSISGLAIEQVQVVDVAAGKPRVITTEESASSSVAMEHAQRVEEQTRRKLEELLAYIPGVSVAVTASVDVTRSVSETQEYLPLKAGTVQLEKKTDETENVSHEASAADWSKGGGDPGFAANQSADINRGGGEAGSRTQETKATTEFDNRVGTKVEKVVDPRGQSVSVAVSVNVPKGYVSRLVRSASGADPADEKPPAEADVTRRFEEDVKPQVVAALTPHVRAMLAQANPQADAKAVRDFITVSMVPVELPPAATQQAGLGSALTGGGGALGLSSSIVDKVVLGALSLAAMGMMIAMLRRAGKKTELPAAEELVGMPPSLDAGVDAVGEAEESDAAMAGIEVGEDEMEAKKILEQVEALVDKDPQSASKLLGRWVRVEE